jgi:protein-disulfide isomerase-like protein with CxxC motif
MENTVLKDAESETGLDLRNMIEYVDITDLEANLSTNRLKQEWDVASYPAFVACRVRNGMIEISNTLQWNPSSPISTSDLIRWLELNNLYDGNS